MSSEPSLYSALTFALYGPKYFWPVELLKTRDAIEVKHFFLILPLNLGRLRSLPKNRFGEN